jgi:hypothetical protein
MILALTPLHTLFCGRSAHTAAQNRHPLNPPRRPSQRRRAPARCGLLAIPPVMGVICAGSWLSEGRCCMKEGGLVPAAAPSPSRKGNL